MIDSKIQRWGNSAALRIPATLLRAWGIEEGQAITMEVQDGVLMARPAQKRYTLAELMAQCDFSIPADAQECQWLDTPAAGQESI